MTTYDSLLEDINNFRELKTDYDWHDAYAGPSDFDIMKSGLSSIGGSGSIAGSIISGIGNVASGFANRVIKGREAMDKTYKQNTKNELLNTNAIAGLDAKANSVNYNSFRDLMSNQDPNILAFGGNLSTNGSNWSDGLDFIDAGGSHEQNPLGGVPISITQDGQLNLLQEGEGKYGDFVFSNKIYLTKKEKKEFGIKSAKKLSVADAARKLQKYAEERPNDPIEKNGLQSVLEKLASLQEMKKQMMMEKQQMQNMADNVNTFALGGKLGINPDLDVDVEDDLNNDKNGNKNTFKSPNLPTSGPQEYARYAPFVLDGISLITDAAGLTNKATYEHSKKMVEDAKKANAMLNDPAQASYERVNLKYNPIDRFALANGILSNTAGLSRNMMNTSNANVGSFLSGALAMNRTANESLGNAYLQGQLQNYNMLKDIAGIQLQNSAEEAKVNLANAETLNRIRQLQAKQYLDTALLANKMNYDEDVFTQMNKNENIQTAVSNAYQFGEDAANRFDLNALINSGVFGNTDNGYMLDRAYYPLLSQDPRSREYKWKSSKRNKKDTEKNSNN